MPKALAIFYLPFSVYNAFTMSYEGLATRTVAFSSNVIKFCSDEKKSLVNRPLIDQLIRSATSIGANYSEANNAASKQDFKNKIFIAKKEAAETKYWLTLIGGISDNKQVVRKLYQECQYILMTLQKIINTLNNRK